MRCFHIGEKVRILLKTGKASADVWEITADAFMNGAYMAYRVGDVNDFPGDQYTYDEFIKVDHAAPHRPVDWPNIMVQGEQS